MNGNSVKHTNPTPKHEDEVVPKQWIENNFLNRYSPASTMARDLNMDGHHVSYLRAPEQNHHAATKGYADKKLPLLGGDMQGDIDMGGNRISHLGEPEQDNDAVNKRTLDDMIQGLQLYNKEHFVSADATSQLRGPVSFNGKKILNLGDPENNDDAVNLRTLQTEISQNNTRELPKYLRLDGSSEPTNDLTMSDNRITNLASPTSPKDAATKKYVNDQLSAPAADTVTRPAGDLDMSQFKIINLKNPKNPQDAVNRRYVEKNFLQKDEDINLEEHRTTGLTHPSYESDATSKRYVDTEIFRQIDENNRVEAVKFFLTDMRCCENSKCVSKNGNFEQLWISV